MENSQESTALPLDQRPLSYKRWALYIFLSGLPLIGLILMLVWAFGSEGNIHRKAWAKGMLLIYVIVIVLSILFATIFGVGLATLIGSQQ